MPNLFAQVGGYSEPNDIFAQVGGHKENTNPTPFSQITRNLLPSIGADIASGGAQAGYNLLNAPANAAQYLGQHGLLNQTLANAISKLRTPEMSPQDINAFYGKLFGVSGQPNTADELLRGAAQYTPAMLAGGAPLAGRLAASGLYGLTQSPSSPVLGAATAMAGEAAPELLGGAKTLGEMLATKAGKSFMPVEQAKDILADLSGQESGNYEKNIEQNGKDLAESIKDKFAAKKKEEGALYNPITNQVGDNLIYPTGYRSISPDYSQYKTLLQNNPEYIKSFDVDLKDLNNKFIKNATFNNAHKLQSQLAYAQRNAPTESIADQNASNFFGKAREALRNDMSTFLNVKDPNLNTAYQNATDRWAQEIVPYLQNPKIAAIAQGNVTNPKNVTNIFAAPSDDTLKVVNDLGDDAKNKIIYAQLAKGKNAENPEALLNAYNKLDDMKLKSSYVTPKLEQQIENLKQALINKKGLQALGGAAAGYLTGAHFLGPEAGTVGAVGGGMLPLMLAKPAGAISSLLGRILAKSYPYAKAALIPAAINAENQQFGGQ